jgi:hypothetical protein
MLISFLGEVLLVRVLRQFAIEPRDFLNAFTPKAQREGCIVSREDFPRLLQCGFQPPVVLNVQGSFYKPDIEDELIPGIDHLNPLPPFHAIERMKDTHFELRKI